MKIRIYSLLISCLVASGCSSAEVAKSTRSLACANIYSAEQKEALTKYRGSYAREINHYLRGGRKNHGTELDRLIRNLDAAFDVTPPITEDRLVYRFENYEGMPNYSRGQQIDYLSYISASPNRRMVEDTARARRSGSSQLGRAFHIHLRTGDKVISYHQVFCLNHDPIEDEFILPRDLKLRINSITNQGQFEIYDVTTFSPR